LLSRYDYNTLDALSRVQAPVLVAHSPSDDIIPYSHAQRLYAAAREPKAFLELSGGHNNGFVFMRPEWVNALGAFLEQTQPPQAKAAGAPESNVTQ
jgi:uncharacterized protein